jgi:hypothetical protein
MTDTYDNDATFANTTETLSLSYGGELIGMVGSDPTESPTAATVAAGISIATLW